MLGNVFSKIPFLPKLFNFVLSPAGKLAIGLLRANKGRAALLFVLSNITALAVSSRVVIFIAFLQTLAGKQNQLVMPLPMFSLSIPALGELGGRTGQLVVLLASSVALSVLSLSMELINRRLTARLSMRFTAAVRKMAISHALRLDTGYYSSNKMGTVGVELFTPISVIPGMLMTSQIILASLLQIVGVSAVIFYLSPSLTLSMCIAGLLFLGYMGKFHSVLGLAAKKLRELEVVSGGVSNDLLYGMRVIKQSGQEITQRHRFIRAFKDADQQRVRVADIQATGNFLIQLGGMVTILFFAGLVSVLNGVNLIEDMGFTLGYFMALWRLFNEVFNVTGCLNALAPQMPYLSSLAALLQDRTHDERNVFGDGAQTEVPRNLDVKIKGLNFFYAPDRSVLRNIDLSLTPGTITAVVGLSGSGKTTLFELLSRLRAPQSGVISYGGVPAEQYNLRSLRGSIGYVNQETILFNESAIYNIRLARPKASFEEVKHAAWLAAADEFIDQLPNGYDSFLGERGQQISGGQRQRIALARVFLQDPKLLLLDEATSGLDIQTERLILSRLSLHVEDKAVVIATHRLVTVTGCHQIIFLHDGQIVESGTHDELMAKRGMYCDLFRFQTEALGSGLSPDLEF